jgi:hypothetical protein
LDAALSLAQTQLVGQLADETSVDGRTMGTLGFSGALLAACLAARSPLGTYWWMPALVLSIATLLCFSPTLWFGEDSTHKTDLGPVANAFYQMYGGQRPRMSREQLLSDLDRAFASNMRRLDEGARPTSRCADPRYRSPALSRVRGIFLTASMRRCCECFKHTDPTRTRGFGAIAQPSTAIWSVRGASRHYDRDHHGARQALVALVRASTRASGLAPACTIGAPPRAVHRIARDQTYPAPEHGRVVCLCAPGRPAGFG